MLRLLAMARAIDRRKNPPHTAAIIIRIFIFLVLHDAFSAFDTENKNSISLDVIGTILELLGHEVNEDELDDVLDEYDEDDSGEIEFEEFVKLASRFVEPEEDYEHLRKELREVFMLYDKECESFYQIHYILCLQNFQYIFSTWIFTSG